MKIKTKGVSYKLVADLLTSVVAFAIGYFGVELDPALAAVVAKAVGFIAGVIAPPNQVEPVPAVDGQAGLALLEAVVILLVVAVIVLAVFVF